jgi:SAM-dependent methyltransferase
MTSADHWNRQAGRWAAWARAPGHDSYWTESGPPFFELVPAAGRRTLDLGCGEGRVARDLKARGHQVVGLDSSAALIRLAKEADPGGEYVVGDAASLPLPDASFDLVVAFNSLMDLDDMPASVQEAARVLENGGRFCVCITHPMRDAGRYRSSDPDAPFVITEPYFGKRKFGPMTIARGGYEMTFAGWCYPLEDYMRAFEDAGFLIESLREPPDPARPLPNFLLIRALRPA